MRKHQAVENCISATCLSRIFPVWTYHSEGETLTILNEDGSLHHCVDGLRPGGAGDGARSGDTPATTGGTK